MRKCSNSSRHFAQAWLIEKAFVILALAGLILLFFSSAAFAAAMEKEVQSGSIFNFVARNISQEDVSFEWKASDGSPTSSRGRSLRWTAPTVDSPKNVVILLSLTNSYGCSQDYTNRINIRVVPKPVAKIELKKECLFTAPVRIGDYVVYTYNVTNQGNQPLEDLNLTDLQNWGPNCLPGYRRGDDGNDVLDPGESWWYEYRYPVPDPSDYPMLSIMESKKSSTQLSETIQKLMEKKIRLEIVMENLRRYANQFDMLASDQVTSHEIRGGLNYTFYNYSNEVTGESFSKIVDFKGNLNKTIYGDPLTGAVLTVQYDEFGKILSEELYYPPPRSKEYLKIEYDLPARGYKTITIIDYSSGDTLVLIVDGRGNILSKEYKITPGYKPYLEKYFLKNTATVTAKTRDGKMVSDSDSFTLEVFSPLPILRITKTAEPDPVNPGGILNYSIVYENIGGADAHDVVLQETYNKSLAFLWSDRAPSSGTVDRWNLGDLAVGESGQIRIQTLVSPSIVPGSQITNQAKLECKESSWAMVMINTTVAEAVLNISKTASVDIIQPGGNLTYTIKYRNEGSVKQTNVTIHDWLDANVILDADNSRSDPILLKNGSHGNYLWWYRGDLDPGEYGTITIRAKVKDKDAFKGNVTSVINTYRINSSQIEGKKATFETIVVLLHSLWINKKADKSDYNREENITYTINYGNTAPFPADNVSVTDLLPKVDLISASPPPNPGLSNGSVLNWTIGSLAVNETGTIKIIVQIPKKARAKFDETSFVQGEGYVYVRKGLSTEEKKESLINRATISGDYGKSRIPPSSCTSTVTILGWAGTRMTSIEHGSGHYEEEAKSSLCQENKSISLDKDIFAKYRKATFSLPANRSLNYNSLWSDFTMTENKILGDVIGEKFLYMDTLNKSSSFLADMNQTVYKSEADFNSGMAQISYKKHDLDKRAAVLEIDENYHGSFRVAEAVDSYGESVKFSKSGIGKGFVSSDKRAKGRQRSYESGSGYYSSEESSQLGEVEKYTKMLYAPAFSMAGSQNISYANLWSEGMLTKEADRGQLISEEIRYASFVDKEALMEKSSLSLLGKFNGTLNIQLEKGQSLDLDETFIGSYQIDTAISVYTTPRHLYPHVNISKEAIMLDENTVLFLINVSNDGNKLLRPLNVTDYLPEGCSYINSSIRAKTNGSTVNWTIPSLDIGRKLTIKMRAKVEGERAYYTNRVRVRATCKESMVEARNSTTFEAYYRPLPCCPGVGTGADADNKINATSLSNAIGYWGEWNPSPGFNITGNMTECSCEADAYYDELEKNPTKSCCASNYDVP